MTFKEKEQTARREAFIKDCRQKAWSAACHADWISKNLDELVTQYQKLQEDDRTLENEIKAAELALDAHTVDNRNKRKELQGRRDKISEQMKLIMQSANAGQQAMTQLQQSVESSLQLAEHAETWEWKEVDALQLVEAEGSPVFLVASIMASMLHLLHIS
jgi:hypothetical protein